MTSGFPPSRDTRQACAGLRKDSGGFSTGCGRPRAASDMRGHPGGRPCMVCPVTTQEPDGRCARGGRPVGSPASSGHRGGRADNAVPGVSRVQHVSISTGETLYGGLRVAGASGSWPHSSGGACEGRGTDGGVRCAARGWFTKRSACRGSWSCVRVCDGGGTTRPADRPFGGVGLLESRALPPSRAPGALPSSFTPLMLGGGASPLGSSTPERGARPA